ncbi:hypothetical protein [Roseateles chitinivorans]|uniref:hypothetical protein n=1 Tax=Roseateles chitinivorans TaxID=2917965 RepID=UPI003D670B73
MLPITAPAAGQKNAVPLHVTLPTLPAPGVSSDVTPAATATTPPETSTGAMPRIKSFLRLRPDFFGYTVHPEEGRMRVVLQAVHDALAPMSADLPEATTAQRARLRTAVAAHLTAQLKDISLDTMDLAFLNRVAGLLVAATLDGDYAGLQGNGDRLDTIRGAILEPKELRESVLVRRWGIGDLSDDGVEATPSSLRSKKVPVHRGSALLAEGLLATAYLAGQLHGKAPPSPELARRVAAARLTAYLLVSALAHEPMLFDLDRLDRLTARADSSALGPSCGAQGPVAGGEPAVPSGHRRTARLPVRIGTRGCAMASGADATSSHLRQPTVRATDRIGADGRDRIRGRRGRRDRPALRRSTAATAAHADAGCAPAPVPGVRRGGPQLASGKAAVHAAGARPDGDPQHATARRSGCASRAARQLHADRLR